ncbi:hypothetical protein [Legionella parisiensis]|uniref:Peptidase metallopeptidase domain-containing protein n=1 Tax=Legionella parisiensis TaxID=45071 RepID=A0A1E5JKM2_9GAMM|nr:hypothetical protein [Legionella parisiensis]KTD43029.1 hypothetical protein Lpar_1006 [Legionella parisiensis]OEH45101.1 hypothetical protein lpari_03871 [Legionella parisiensis]STX77897.1 Uncharacterised protein [Legionella parisiensis]
MPKENILRALTPDEIRSATLHFWPRRQKTVNIPYSFDLSIIPQRLKKEALERFSQISFDPLNVHSIKWLQEVLHKWQESCENAVKFTYVDKIHTDVFNGIVIANCDNMNTANGYWQRVYSSSNQFLFGLVCIPSNYYDDSGKLIEYNLRTISHEIGHAIGLGHLHDVESLRIYLQNSPEGMGYSVMPYLDNITSDVSLCVNMDACLNTTYAIMPGPLDAQMCQALYGEDSLFFHKPSRLEELQTYAYGGASIGYTLGICNAMEYLFTRLGDTHINAHLKVVGIYYSIILLSLVYNSNSSNYLSLFEQAQQLMIPLGGELCHIIFKLLGDYLQSKNLHVLSHTLEITATSLQFLALSKGLLDATRDSFHTTWNYGATFLSGIASYGISNSIGKYIVNTLLSSDEKNTEHVEQTPKKGLLSSFYGFFGTKSKEKESDIQTPKLAAYK